MLDLTAVVVSLILLSVISIVLNTFCIYIMRKNTKFQEKPSSVFVINLLLIHIFQGMFVFPLYAVKKIKVEHCFWKNFFKDAFLASYIVSYYGACFGVLIISLDRFLATYLLNRYKIYSSLKNALVVLLVTWVYVILLCAVPLVPQAKAISTERIMGNDSSMTSKIVVNSTYDMDTLALTVDPLHDIPDTVSKMSLYTEPGKYSTKSNETLGTISPSSLHGFVNTTVPTFSNCKNYKKYYLPQREWTVFMVFCNSALPLILIICSYMYVVMRLKRLRPSLGKKTDGTQKGKHSQKGGTMKVKEFRKYQQVTRLTQVLSVTYTLCWSPSIIYYTIFSVCEHRCFPKGWDNSYIEKHLVYIIKYIMFANSLFSPLIYCFHHPEMQQRLSKMKHTFAIQPESTLNEKGYKLSIHHIELNNLALPDERSLGGSFSISETNKV